MRTFNPANLIWVICHIVLLFIGASFFTLDWVSDQIGTGVASGIGGSIVATGVTGIVLYLYVRASESARDRLEMLSKAGLLKIFRARSVRIKSEYDDRLHSAKEIDLIGYGLSAFREDYSNEFVEWSTRAIVRILLPDPDFPSTSTSYADQRDSEEGNPPGKTRRDIEAFEQTVADLEKLDRSRFQVKRVRAIPSINLLRIDNEIFWGPYLFKTQSRNTPTILVSNGFLYDALRNHFNALWSQQI